MSSQQLAKGKRPTAFLPAWLFPLCVTIGYGILFAFNPEQVDAALRSSASMFIGLIPALAVVFLLMLAMNLYAKSAQVANLLGKDTRSKGIMLSVAFGIISMGPIYAWYPLLKEMKEKGAGNLPIAIFLYARAVKPALLPVLVAYFGWVYTASLTIIMVFGSVVVGYSINLVMPQQTHE